MIKDCNSDNLVFEKLAKMSEWLWGDINRISMLSAHFQAPLYREANFKIFPFPCHLLQPVGSSPPTPTQLRDIPGKDREG